MIKKEQSPQLKYNAESNSKIGTGEIVIGIIVKVDHTGVYVDFSQNPSEGDLQAISTIPVAEKNVGREVALLFNGGDLRHPVIMGMIHSAMLDALENTENDQVNSEDWLNQPLQAQSPATEKDNSLVDVVVDGQKHSIEAQNELTLKCGKSSITLTKEGKILLRGTYLSSRSSGTNRILGGSVLLN